MTTTKHGAPIIVTRVTNGFLLQPAVLEAGRFVESKTVDTDVAVVVEADDPEDMGRAIFGMLGVEQGRVKPLVRVARPKS